MVNKYYQKKQKNVGKKTLKRYQNLPDVEKKESRVYENVIFSTKKIVFKLS